MVEPGGLPSMGSHRVGQTAIRWMKMELIIQSEVSHKEKHQYSISSVQFSRSVVSDSLRPHEL